MWDRRKWCQTLAISALGLGARCHGYALAATGPKNASQVDEKTQQAINRGLAFLAQSQNEDGSFGDDDYAKNVGVCSLAGLSFLASGSTPSSGRWGENIEATVAFILKQASPSGFMTVKEYQSRGPMYGHGFATLFLSEVYGMSSDRRVRQTLFNAIKVIVETQNEQGGWRYQPRKDEADVSVTVCQLMALRAARNAGVFVPDETVSRAVDYLHQSQNVDGGFMYMNEERESAFPRSAAAIVALYNAGESGTSEIERGLDYLDNFLPRKIEGLLPSHFFYGHYYAVQAMWHAGGKRWDRWYPAIRDVLLPLQKESGAWSDLLSETYATAMAGIILQVPNNLLPILQR
ncbi:MAG: terpene cyclase/mutase family protein [Pirellulaceae bacterium]|nr:terpene cyclase/mutase family protein [Pirellulaceae bacterium]